MQKQLSISFIVPVYNTQEYIEKCVHSISSLKKIDYEIIIIDDGSTDNSGVICDNLSNKYSNIKVIHTQNSGVSHARNVGIKESKGKWLSFIDSDDFINEKFNILINYLNDPNIELIHYGWTYINNKVSNYQVIKSTKDLTYKTLFARKIFHGYVWSYLFRKDIISQNNILFSTDMKYAEDWEFIFKYYSYLKHNVIISHECIYNQVCRIGSATNQKLGVQYINDNFKMYDRVLSVTSNNSKDLKQVIIYHLQLINIWLSNNIIYSDYYSLRKTYKNNVKKLFYKHPCFSLSPIILVPAIISHKSIYKFCVMIHNKIHSISQRNE